MPSLTLVMFLGGGVVGASLDDLLYVLGLHVDGHGTDDCVGRRCLGNAEANWTRGCHAYVQLLERF